MATYTNQATLSFTGGSVQSNIVSGEIVGVLSVLKNAVNPTYSPEDRVTYTVTLVNSGTSDIAGLTLVDDLGAYTVGTSTYTPLTFETGSILYFINGVQQPSPTVSPLNPLTVTGISVPAGGNTQIVYEVVVNEYAPLGENASVTNTATVSSATINPISDEVEITPGLDPTLTIDKSVSPNPVTENGTVTYTFIIQNIGNTAADASYNIVVADTFTPILTNLTATLDGTTLALNTDYTYNATTGAFATNTSRVTVPAATYVQDPTTGVWVTTPGVTTLTVSGTI